MQLQSHIRVSHGLIPYEQPCEIWHLQKAQLSQRDCVMLCVVENFAKLLNAEHRFSTTSVTKNYTNP